MYVIGIDIGTGSTKAIALEHTGNVLVSAQVPYPTFSPEPGASEQDPETIWQAFAKCINRITAALTEPPAAIALSSAMHSVICVNEEGSAISPLITWADNRSSDVATRLRGTPRGISLYRQTGTPIHAMSPLCKLIWLKENDPVLFSKTHKFISIKEFCWFRLFGTYEVDYSIASATGLFNIVSCTWNEDSLSMLGIDESRLSTPVNADWMRAGLTEKASALLKLPTQTPFVAGGSDGCLANVGSFATQRGVAALTIGTSGAIRVAGAAPVMNDTYMPFNYRLNDHTFISGGPINNGGVALKWYAEKLLKAPLATTADYERVLSALDRVSPGAEGLLFLPYLLGERAPIWNSDTCGVFFGITGQHEQDHFTRAVIEGITFSLYQIANALMKGGLEINVIHISGGFVRSKAWVQTLCNIFGKQLRLMNVDDASAIGAALIAMERLNIRHDIEHLSSSESIVFEPDPEIHERYRSHYFPMYESLYRALVLEMKIFHENRAEATTTHELNIDRKNR